MGPSYPKQQKGLRAETQHSQQVKGQSQKGLNKWKPQ